MKKIFTLLLSIATTQLTAQGFHRTFGSLGAGIEVANCIIQTSDGGFVMAGSTSGYGAGSNDVYIVKTDANGHMVWQQVIGGSGNDDATGIVEHSSGAIYVSGSTTSYGAGLSDIYLVKLNSSGDVEWTNTYGGAQNEFGKGIVITTSGDLVIGGYTNGSGAGGTDAYLINYEFKKQ